MSIRKANVGGVLTGDIVNSTRLAPQQEAELIKALDDFLREYPHEFYRGDSFQVYVKEPAKALRLALACRAVAIEITTRAEATEAPIRGDIRIGIGIGAVDMPIRSLGSAKGDAFLLSGRELDELQKTESRLAISCGDKVANIGLQIMADYLDNIFTGMTGKQADVIVELLQGTTQQHLSQTREKAKSTISELANAGRWPEIEKMLKQYEQLIELLP